METVNMKDVISIKKMSTKRKMKVAHFAQFAPHAAGISGTAIDMVLAERAVGIDSILIDYNGTKKPSIVGHERSGVVTVGPSQAKDADIITRHSAVPTAIKNTGIPMVMCLHGRPEYTYLLEYIKKSCIIGEYLKCAKDPQYMGFITFWEQHLDYLNILLPSSKIDYVPAMVDLDLYNPKGIKYDYSDVGGTPNILIADMFREDVNPFNMLVAAAIFRKKYCPEAKVHIYGLQRLKESPVKDLIDAMKVAGVIGEAKPLVADMDRIYRSCDMLITPHVIATRIVREALASGLPIVGGNGNPYTSYQANHLDVHGFAEEISRCWEDICKEKYSRELQREVAKDEFSVKKAGEAILPIYERILAQPKPVIKIRTKPNFRIYNFIAMCTPDEGKYIGKAYNEYMKLVPDDSWVCFLDHDAMFLTANSQPDLPNWQDQLYAVIQDNPEYSCFSVITNRIGNPDQRFAGIDQNNHDIQYHRRIGERAYDQHYTEVKDVTNGHCISGVVMLVKKSAWKKVGGFKTDGPQGVLGVDNKFHLALKQAGCKIGLMKGVYCYHWYRADGKGLRPVNN